MHEACLHIICRDVTNVFCYLSRNSNKYLLYTIEFIAEIYWVQLQQQNPKLQQKPV